MLEVAREHDHELRIEACAPDRQRMADQPQHPSWQPQLQTQTAELVRSAAQDPDAAGRARIAALKEHLAQFDVELRGVQQGLVPPTRMTRVLEDVLTRNSRVHLVKLKTLPVTALVADWRFRRFWPCVMQACLCPAPQCVSRHGPI